MDGGKKGKGFNKGFCWTNEKHMHYLNSMEASFVRAAFGGYDDVDVHLRLDRDLPDTSDSTVDMMKKSKKINNNNNDDINIERRRRHSTSGVEDRRNRQPSSELLMMIKNNNISSQDQVVPQMESKD